MKPAKTLLPPSSSLPPLRAVGGLTEKQILVALDNLSAIYCPLPVPVSLNLGSFPRIISGSSSPPTDSGYASEIDTSKTCASKEETLTRLRADAFERDFAERWLSGFIGRADTLLCDFAEDARQYVIDQAACILEALFATSASDDQLDGGLDDDFVHEFSFHLALPDREPTAEPINIKLRDRLAGRNNDDHEDVGLQVWGASIILSRLLCASPSAFDLTEDYLGPSPRIIELGAGTGLASLVLSSILPRLGFLYPRVISTDYHPQVLENLHSNVDLNGLATETALLDWANPAFEAPLDKPADMLIAADVVYGPEHASLLRNCASRFLAPHGVFWLLISVRENGKFNGISSTVKAAFSSDESPASQEGRVLRILHSQELEKRKGIGREDESGYLLFRIGWVEKTQI
ncbi:hypothetical protein jhhlp_006681 [Lomentospora prolificans]|uniref:Methyltransferase domain-containing protein n=1 Tax=Lomentospora prolificans TaxID=41688 RepID=A0A2N3N6K0_9PEZI|nr:hypothetical protein jhhlp_006681 [Lomentospora prolificans]